MNKRSFRGSKANMYYYSGKRRKLKFPITLEMANGKTISYIYNSIITKASEDECSHLHDYFEYNESSITSDENQES
jgi:hypothetical protein